MEMVDDQLVNHSNTGSPNAQAGKLAPEEFMRFVDETRSQPMWRVSADKSVDYYDGNQLPADVLTELDNQGFGSLMTNLVKPAIDAVLGIEAKSRTDFRVASDDDQNMEVAEALSAKLKEAERESHANRACSDAYGGQVKAGMGWVHVTRESDPFRYPYKAESVHRREMFWDWSAKDPALDDARYVIRQKWFPTDQVTAAMPEHAPLINASASGWQPDWMQRARESTTLMNALDQENRISVSAWEWRNIDNRRVALQECWYAAYVRGLVLRLPTGKTVEFNQANPVHMAVISAGLARPEPAVYRKMRCSMWFGPHLLQDTDAGKTKMPYVPFWGFREDLTGVPYGLVRSMVPLQDEVNARRRKLMWLLSSKRVQMDSDSLDARYNDLADVVNEISRPDSVLITNPTRLNKAGAIRIESDLGLSSQQFEILQEAKEGIQSAAGIFNSMMGKADGAKSGLAINSLVEQGSNTLGGLNDNFKFARQLVGQRLLDLIREDMSGQAVTVMAGANEAKRKVISLNQPQIDEITGVRYFANDTDRAEVKVALEDVPSTPAYRQQQQMQQGEVIKSLPPQAQAVLMPFYIEGSDLPKRFEMAAAVRKALGIADPNGEQQQDPQIQALQQQIQQLNEQSQKMAQSYEQAVQEQAQKTQAADQQVQQLTAQVRDRGQELALRGQELQLKATESAASAQERMQALQIKQGEQGVQQAQLQLKEQELQLTAAKNSADQSHRQAEFAHAQDSAAADREQAQLTAAGAPPPVERDEAGELAKLQSVVEKLLGPLSEQIDLLVTAAHADAAEDAREDGVENVGAAPGKKGKPAPSAGQPIVINLNTGNGQADDAEDQAEGAAPGKARSAAPRRQVTFTYGADGRISGALVNGAPAATVKRGPDGQMLSADIVNTPAG